jgi:predicted SprT family Zn-dependent metalloprotease
MVNSRMGNVERPLYEIDRFVQRKKVQVTRKPVFTEVSRTGFKDPHEMAHLVTFPNAQHPNHYAVVLKTTFYNRNKNQNLPKLKQVAAHELAHIAVPHQHNERFRRTARRLGAGKYDDTGRG